MVDPDVRGLRLVFFQVILRNIVDTCRARE